MAECANCVDGKCQCEVEEDFLSGKGCDLENKEDCEACQ